MDTPVNILVPDGLPANGNLYPARLGEWLRRLCLACGGVTVALGAAVLAGWLLGLDALKGLTAGFGTMKANTALGFVGAGTAILALAGARLALTRVGRAVSAVAAAVPLLVGTLTLAQYTFGWDLGIDELLFRDPRQLLYPGRMAPTTAVCLTVLGASLLLAQGGRWHASAGLAAVPMLGGFLAVLGYLFGASALYRLSSYTSMALNTASAFFTASLGAVLLQSGKRVVASSSAGGVLLRRLVPQAIVSLVALGWVRLLGQRAGLYGTEMGLAVMTAGAVCLVTALIHRTARLLHGVDLERLGAEQALRTLNAELEDRVDERTAELAASELRLRNLAEASHEAIIVDENGIVVEANQVSEEMYGYERDELIGLAVEKLVAPESREHALETIAAAAEGRWDVLALHRDGTRFWASGTARNASYGGRPVRVAAIRDISHRKRVEEALRAALAREHEAARLLGMARDEALETSRLKSDFLANMSHEIRTPMNAVIGMTGLLLETPLTTEQREFASAVRGAGEALLEIINDILDFSKIEAGKLRLEPTEFELRLVVEEVTDLLALRAYEKGLELAGVVDPDVPVIVHGDPGRLRQILTNLAGNAVKFTERGEVVIRVRAESDPCPSGPPGQVVDTVSLDAPAPSPAEERSRTVVARFEVVDTGIGIAESDRQQLFQSFHQIDTSAARRYRGTGLGLAISKQLAELMGGTIGVESQPGAGSTFWFTLPMGVRDATASPAPAAYRSPELAGVRVLVVDDNVTARAIVVEQLRSWAVSADGTASGVEALTALRGAARSGEPFDVVLIDWGRAQREGMTGPTLAAAISADPAIAATRLVVLTSSTDRSDRPQNVDAHLTKPLRESQLLECLERVVRGVTTETLEVAPGSPRIAGSAQSPDSLVPPRLFTERLLVAEDNPVNQVVAMRMLERLGYRADVVGNGEEVLEAMSRIDYAVVLMDCQMPELDGFDTTREIRRREARGRHTPVIAMTAHAMQGDRDRCVEAGMDDYVSKPVRSEQLAAVLRRWVGASDVTV